MTHGDIPSQPTLTPSPLHPKRPPKTPRRSSMSRAEEKEARQGRRKKTQTLDPVPCNEASAGTRRRRAGGLG